MTATARIDELRGSIDGLDRQIVALLAARTRVVEELTEYKSDEEAVRSPGRVEQVITKVRRLAAEHGMPPRVAEATYRSLITELTGLQLDRLAERRAAGRAAPAAAGAVPSVPAPAAAPAARAAAAEGAT